MFYSLKINCVRHYKSFPDVEQKTFEQPDVIEEKAPVIEQKQEEVAEVKTEEKQKKNQ